MHSFGHDCRVRAPGRQQQKEYYQQRDAGKRQQEACTVQPRRSVVQCTDKAYKDFTVVYIDPLCHGDKNIATNVKWLPVLDLKHDEQETTLLKRRREWHWRSLQEDARTDQAHSGTPYALQLQQAVLATLVQEVGGIELLTVKSDAAANALSIP